MGFVILHDLLQRSNKSDIVLMYMSSKVVTSCSRRFWEGNAEIAYYVIQNVTFLRAYACEILSKKFFQ